MKSRRSDNKKNPTTTIKYEQHETKEKKENEYLRLVAKKWRRRLENEDDSKYMEKRRDLIKIAL